MEFCKVWYSVLSCLLFIQDLISAHNLACIFYADDSQLYITYITADPLDQRPALNTPLQKCISEVIESNTINELLCNPSKTEVIQFSSHFVQNPILSDFLIQYNYQTEFVILVST